MRLLAFTCGWLTGDLGGFLAGEAGKIRVPVPCYLIDHPRGKVLFDSGLHPDTQTDPAGRLGRLARFFDVEFAPGEDLRARLGSVGIDPDGIPYLVNSHLHFDHTGGNATIPNARLVVQRREWEAGLDDELVRTNFYDPKDYRTGHDVVLVDGEHDLFGDGRVVCVPTYGHTPGHQSLRVHLDSGDVLLAADACYLKRTLDDLHPPANAHDRAQLLATLRGLRELQAGGLRIFYGHDPEFWQSVPQAPAEVS
jgi:N-acyl homoserine lactone hydrolase